MDGKEIILAVITGLVAFVQLLIGFIVKDMKMQISQNRTDNVDTRNLVESVRNELYKHYPNKQDLKDAVDDLKSDNKDMDKKLDSIIEKIGARKPH